MRRRTEIGRLLATLSIAATCAAATPALAALPPTFLGAEYRNIVTAHPVPIEGVDWGGAGFGGGADVAFNFFGSTLDPGVQPDSFSTVRLTFSHSVTQKAYRFLRLEVQGTGASPPQGRAYLYAGFHTMNFTARDTVSGVQLEVAIVERCFTNSGGTILSPASQPASFDSTWSPDTSAVGGREYLTVFRRAYSGTPADTFARDGAFMDSSLPGLYSLWSRRKAVSDVIDDGDAFVFRWGVPSATIQGHLSVLCDDPAGPLQNIQVLRTDPSGTFVHDTTYTDMNGFYQFPDVELNSLPDTIRIQYQTPGITESIPDTIVVLNTNQTVVLDHSVLCRFTPPVDLTATGTNGRDPDLAIAGGKSMIAVWERDNLTVAHSLSTDSSKTFSLPAPLTTPGRQPAAVRTPLATLLIAAAAPESMVCTRSDDGGISMAPLPTVVVRRGGVRAPALAVDGFGRVYLSFDTNSDSVLFARSTNDGLSFGALLTVSSPLSVGRRHRNSDVASNGNDTVYVAWCDSFLALPVRERIRLNRSGDGGVSFLGATTLSDPARRAVDVAIATSTMTVHAMWVYRGSPDSLHYARSINSGATFSRVAAVAIPADPGTGGAVSFVREPGGTLHAVVQAKLSGSEECFYFSLPSGSVTFEAATNVSNSSDPSTAPVVVLDNMGRPMIAWSEVIGGGREIVYTRRVR